MKMVTKTIDQMGILFYTDYMLYQKPYQNGQHKLSDSAGDSYCPSSGLFDLEPEVRVSDTMDGGITMLEDACLRVQSARDVCQMVIMQD